MKLNSLQSLKHMRGLRDIPSLKPLIKTGIASRKKALSELEIILYSTDLCFYAMEALRSTGTIHPKVMNEIIFINHLMDTQNYFDNPIYSDRTKKVLKLLNVKSNY